MDLDSMKKKEKKAKKPKKTEDAPEATSPVGMDEVPPDTGAEAVEAPASPPASIDEAIEEHHDVGVVNLVIKSLEETEAKVEIRNSERIESIRLLKMAAVHIRQI